MPIRQYLQSHRFDAETVRLLGIAFEMALVLQQRREIDPLRAAIAQKIIELAETGERDPERLCDEALKATAPMAPVLISDPSPLPPHASPPAQPDS
jgi:hypothetical protein